MLQFVDQLIKKAGDAYNAADEKLDGWLPGGSKQSPVGRSLQESYNNPGYAVEEPPATIKLPPQTPITNYDGTLTEPAQGLIDRYAPGAKVEFKEQGPEMRAVVGNQKVAGYANAGTNTITLTPLGENIDTLAHEIGHLNTDRQGRAHTGAVGRVILEATDSINDIPVLGPALGPALAPVRAIGGLTTMYRDASEEEYAERFRRRVTGGGEFGKNDRSDYGAGLYQQGASALQDAFYNAAPIPAYLLDVPIGGIKPSQRLRYVDLED